MEEKIRLFCQEYGIKKEQRLLLAVSGGRDSMAMLDFFARHWDKSKLTVAHFDHESRQGQSGKDADFVHAYVDSLELDFCLRSAPVQDKALAKKMGFEAMARQMRYEFFEEMARRTHSHWILTAHTAEDNVETFLLHFCRGAGLTGLGGIPPVRDNIARPLLAVNRKEISAYVAEFQVDFVEDESNQDKKYRRNFVRHDILPKLEELNPQYVAHGANTMGIIRKENDFLDSYVQGLLPLEEKPGLRFVKKSDYLAIPVALRLRWIGYFVGGNPSFHQRQRILAQLEGDHYGGFLIYEEATGQILRDFPCEPMVRQDISEFYFYHWGNWFLRVETRKAPDILPLEQKDIVFLRKTEGLFLRSRQVGDKIPVAGRANYSLKKYLQQEKIPPWQRDFVPIVVDEADRILAVGGLVVAEGKEARPGELAWAIHWINRNEV